MQKHMKTYHYELLYTYLCQGYLYLAELQLNWLIHEYTNMFDNNKFIVN